MEHQPAKPASPMLNQKMASCFFVLPGVYESMITSGSFMYHVIAAATAIHSSAVSLRCHRP